MKSLKFYSFLFIFLIVPSVIFAQSQSNFSVSPPPIPWFEWSEGESDMAGAGSYISMSGSGISFKGFNGTILGRYAFSELAAIDAGFNMLMMFGTIDMPGTSADTSFLGFNIPLDIELQLIRTEKFSLIAFAGLNLNYMTGWMSYTSTTTNYDYSTMPPTPVTAEDSVFISMDSSMSGPQAGAQMSIKAENFAFTPFLMIQKLSGSSSYSMTSSYGSYSGSADIPSYTQKSYGLDIIYLPLNLKLSTILQQAASAGDNSGFKTYIFTVSYDSRFDSSGQPIEPGTPTSYDKSGESIDNIKQGKKQTSRKGESIDDIKKNNTKSEKTDKKDNTEKTDTTKKPVSSDTGW